MLDADAWSSPLDTQRFDTLRAVQAAPRHAALPDVLLLLTSAQEFDWVKLRRDEKALMKARALQQPLCLLTVLSSQHRARCADAECDRALPAAGRAREAHQGCVADAEKPGVSLPAC